MAAPGGKLRRWKSGFRKAIDEPSEQMLCQGAAVLRLSSGQQIEPSEIAREIWIAMAAQRKSELGVDV
jgi:hypothetical protein